MSSNLFDLERSLSRRSSSQTLTNSPTSTTNSSRESSVEREKKRTPTKPLAEAGAFPGDKMTRKETGRPWSMPSRIKRYFVHDELVSTYMRGVLMICFFISGLVDAVAFNSWNCFVNMQTGEHPILAPERSKVDTAATCSPVEEALRKFFLISYLSQY
jgi:hypothetical protein